MEKSYSFPLWREGPGDRTTCLLCPHACQLEPGAVGRCGARGNQQGRIQYLPGFRFSGIHLDPVEKKPLYHFHPGRYLLSLGGNGCNLTCPFCQNHVISQGRFPFPGGTTRTIPDLISQAASIDNSVGLSFTYNEPAIWFENMADLALAAKKAGMVNAVISNGYINHDPLRHLLEITDAWNVDLKAWDPDFYAKQASASLEPVKKSLSLISKSGRHLEITHLVIPGLNDHIDDFREMCIWIAEELGPTVPLHISRYFPAFWMTAGPTPEDTLTAFLETARRHLYFVYLGNHRGTEGVHSQCPACGHRLIHRTGYTARITGLTPQGHCTKCGLDLNLSFVFGSTLAAGS